MNNKEQFLLDKAERILKSNIYIGNEYPWGKYRLISPGKGIFNGVWNWDSAFHAIGMLDFDKEIAKEQISGFFEYQTANGMLPDVIWESGKIEDRFTKPPVMAWATAEVYRATKDIEFLKKIYPKLVFNEGFWVKERLYEGLFHYDADKSRAEDEAQYLQHIGYESGWDNSPRFDNAPYGCWAIDLNCFMVMTYDALIYLAGVLGADSDEWKNKREQLVLNIEQKLWNEALGSYTDYNFKTNEFVNVLTPASFMPLFAGFADKYKAEKMEITAQEHFLPGMPTVAYDDSAYGMLERSYWRGPCWLNVAYFAAKGLKKYGFSDTANTVKETILDWVYNDGDFIHENYNSKSGEGLCCDHFSWSCVFVRKFILDF